MASTTSGFGDVVKCGPFLQTSSNRSVSQRLLRKPKPNPCWRLRDGFLPTWEYLLWNLPVNVGMFQKIVNALSYVHRQDMIHRMYRPITINNPPLNGASGGPIWDWTYCINSFIFSSLRISKYCINIYFSEFQKHMKIPFKSMFSDQNPQNFPPAAGSNLPKLWPTVLILSKIIWKLTYCINKGGY